MYPVEPIDVTYCFLNSPRTDFPHSSLSIHWLDKGFRPSACEDNSNSCWKEKHPSSQDKNSLLTIPKQCFVFITASILIHSWKCAGNIDKVPGYFIRNPIAQKYYLSCIFSVVCFVWLIYIAGQLHYYLLSSTVFYNVIMFHFIVQHIINLESPWCSSIAKTWAHMVCYTADVTHR